MVFSSPIFLFFFLPITLLLTFLSWNSKHKNLILLILSVFFYIFGEGELVLMMLASIILNFYLGKWIAKADSKKAISVSVFINLLILFFFKYTEFLIVNVNVFLLKLDLSPLKVLKIKLPAGISFYTFHSISYLIDIYRKQNKVQKSFTDLALYICLFPQLIAGPIVRYKDIAYQFTNRVFKSHQFVLGLQRFIIGLGKKVIISNSIGYTVDTIFNLHLTELSTATAWYAIIAYSLQLYFDFSGYSDMAIGLAKMLGFDFLENFNFPYKAKSIRDFWQRWHISLSNWFRDYLYIPLGGNRVSPARVYLNLSIVFFLTGLWHGASWNFIIWGIIHGIFMIIERAGFGKILEKTPLIFQHFYTLFIVVIAWVFFRIDGLSQSGEFIQSLFTYNSAPIYTLDMFINRENSLGMIIGILLAFNSANYVIKKILIFLLKQNQNTNSITSTFRYIKNSFLILVFIYSILNVVAGTYNPFIYFRF